MMDLEPYFVTVLNSIFVGLGAALGTYLANKYIIQHAKKLKRHIKKVIRK